MNIDHPIIQTQNLQKVYKARRRAGIHAVRDLNLSVMPGEIFGLVGPDGAGKTTTIQMLLYRRRTTGSGWCTPW